GSKRWREAIEAIEIRLTGVQLRAFRSWERRASGMPEPWWRLRSFAEAWYPSAEAAWLLAAEGAGLWEPSQRASATSNQECEKVPGYLGHLGDGRGYVVHLCVESRQRSATLRAHYHGSTVPDSALEHTWTDDGRLTADQ